VEIIPVLRSSCNKSSRIGDRPSAELVNEVMGRVQDYLDSETRYRNDVIVSLPPNLGVNYSLI